MKTALPLHFYTNVYNSSRKLQMSTYWKHSSLFCGCYVNDFSEQVFNSSKLNFDHRCNTLIWFIGETNAPFFRECWRSDLSIVDFRTIDLPPRRFRRLFGLRRRKTSPNEHGFSQVAWPLFQEAATKASRCLARRPEEVRGELAKVRKWKKTARSAVVATPPVIWCTGIWRLSTWLVPSTLRKNIIRRGQLINVVTRQPWRSSYERTTKRNTGHPRPGTRRNLRGNTARRLTEGRSIRGRGMQSTGARPIVSEEIPPLFFFFIFPLPILFFVPVAPFFFSKLATRTVCRESRKLIA